MRWYVESWDAGVPSIAHVADEAEEIVDWIKCSHSGDEVRWFVAIRDDFTRSLYGNFDAVPGVSEATIKVWDIKFASMVRA